MNVQVRNTSADEIAGIAEKLGASLLPANRDGATILTLAVGAMTLVKTILDIWKLTRDLMAHSPSSQVKLNVRGEIGAIDIGALNESEIRTLAERLAKARG